MDEPDKVDELSQADDDTEEVNAVAEPADAPNVAAHDGGEQRVERDPLDLIRTTIEPYGMRPGTVAGTRAGTGAGTRAGTGAGTGYEFEHLKGVCTQKPAE